MSIHSTVFPEECRHNVGTSFKSFSRTCAFGCINDVCGSDSELVITCCLPNGSLIETALAAPTSEPEGQLSFLVCVLFSRAGGVCMSSKKQRHGSSFVFCIVCTSLCFCGRPELESSNATQTRCDSLADLLTPRCVTLPRAQGTERLFEKSAGPI